MAVSRELRNRIRSVSSTKQITKAMELVSSAKMRRASQATVSNRPYEKALLEVVKNVTGATDESLDHPLLHQGESRSTLLIIIAADRGLAGAFTTNILKRSLAHIKDEESHGRNVTCVTIGKKIETALRRKKVSVIQNYSLPSGLATTQDLEALFNFSLKEFTEERFGKVDVIFTNFISMLQNEPVTEALFPLSIDRADGKNSEYLFEPSAKEVFDATLPYIAEIHLYQALLESLASEHSARRVAMKSATDNANSMIDRLQLTYNRLRQGAITQEIAEITSGAAALE